AVTSMRLGNGLWESTQFNARLQPVQIGLGTSVASQNLLKLNYDYGTNDNNGNVLSQTITVPAVGQIPGFTAVQNYSYDSLNRLKSAVENVTPHGGTAVQSWRQTFTFDRYGNRRFDTTNGNTTTLAANCPVAVCNPESNPQNNRLSSTGWQYDAAGNTTADPEGRTFIYDAENKQTEVRDQYNTVIGQNFFDGDGRRVKKIVPATGEVTVFVYDASGKSIAEYSTVVESVENAKVAYLTSDHLGSPRINTDRDGNVTARHDYHPYGEKVYTAQRTAGLAYDADTVRKQFTSYERDNETDLDFAQARMFAHNHGRFTAPDPTLQSLRAENPQTLNRYVYVLNNPLRFVDPLGLWELEYNPEAEKEGDASKLKTIKIYFRKSKDGDNADSLLKQLGFSSKDKGYAEMKSQIEEAMKNMGELGIQASALKGKVDGVNVGEIFKVAGDRLADQAEFDLKEMQAGRAWNGRNGPQNDQYNDCSMTTMRLAFPGRMINERGIGEGTGIFNVGDADDMLPSTQVSGDSLRTGDIVRYQNNNTPTHFMTALFTGDDGITRGFSRSGVNGRYEVVPVQAFVGSPPNGYGNISGRGGRGTGYYRP
ncbi:MAG: RHS repeat-associated core domain-containing protein, partial [Hydrococcus sp. C42_A2020_068]|nr:RHS repeat-associated core domain-containing protein [Hydrococcus sp. C42_A2020_068]